MIAKALFEYLSAQPEIRTEIADDEGVKIFRDRIPHGRKFPAVKMEAIGGNPRYGLSGETDCAERFISLTVIDWSGDNAEWIAELIRLKLSGFRGVMGDVEVMGCTLENERDVTSAPEKGSDDWEFQSACDYRINFRRPLPEV